MADLRPRPLGRALSEALAEPPAPGVRLYWLGQAGFAIEASGRRLVIDPYLSDSLALKYRDGPFPHERMMPPPVDPDGLGRVDLVLATHHHTDHMDPGTLRPLFAARPDLRLVAPAASVAAAVERSGVGAERMLPLDAGDRIEPFRGVAVTATPAAHETLERDEAGRHRFLGYLIEADGCRIWHSGDCVPFEGLVDVVAALRPDVALLPVNGRRPDLSAAGVPGNFTLEEAVAVARGVGARAMIAHHYGLFAFNTADPAAIDAASARPSPPHLLRARTGIVYECA